MKNIMEIKRFLNIKALLLAAVIISLGACEGRRDFAPLTESGVAIDNDVILLVSGETIEVSARFIPNIYPERDYLWEVEDPSVADLQMNDDKSVSVTATGSGETVLKITSQDSDEITAQSRLKVISAAPIDITSQAAIAVNRENSNGREGAEGSPKLIDGDLSTKYLSSYLQPFYVTLQFNEAKIVNLYKFTSGNDAPGRDPLNWQILGSNDGENWDVLDERSGETFSSRGQTREFYFDNDASYTYYRLDVINNNGDGLFQMSEWSVYTFPED